MRLTSPAALRTVVGTGQGVRARMVVRVEAHGHHERDRMRGHPQQLIIAGEAGDSQEERAAGHGGQGAAQQQTEARVRRSSRWTGRPSRRRATAVASHRRLPTSSTRAAHTVPPRTRTRILVGLDVARLHPARHLVVQEGGVRPGFVQPHPHRALVQPERRDDVRARAVMDEQREHQRQRRFRVVQPVQA